MLVARTPVASSVRALRKRLGSVKSVFIAQVCIAPTSSVACFFCTSDKSPLAEIDCCARPMPIGIYIAICGLSAAISGSAIAISSSMAPGAINFAIASANALRSLAVIGSLRLVSQDSTIFFICAAGSASVIMPLRSLIFARRASSMLTWAGPMLVLDSAAATCATLGAEIDPVAFAVATGSSPHAPRLSAKTTPKARESLFFNIAKS